MSAFRRHRGFASVTAIALIAPVSLALMMLMSLLHSDVRRTAGGLVDAQIRQLLIAGQIAARKEIEKGSGGQDSIARPLALPPGLTADGASLAVRIVSVTPSEAEVRVEAQIGRDLGAQTLRFRQSNGAWTLASVNLERGRMPAVPRKSPTPARKTARTQPAR